MLTYHSEMSLALTYSLRRPDLARRCLEAAIGAAILAGRPDLVYAANELLASL